MNPSFNWWRMAFSVIASTTHVAGDDGVSGGAGGGRGPLAAFAHHAHDSAIVGGRRTEQLE